ncbi:hypothetical protein [Lentzea guizhouensis]|uniref:hypothetical protein n=1 Tax=Lentzea guizhouensis TaxID=1586287 RepID=UPI003002C58C
MAAAGRRPEDGAAPAGSADGPTGRGESTSDGSSQVEPVSVAGNRPSAASASTRRRIRNAVPARTALRNRVNRLVNSPRTTAEPRRARRPSSNRPRVSR